jgi:hypothetical protein
LNGINPFSVVPSEGDVPVGMITTPSTLAHTLPLLSGGEKVITIIFEPDHENRSFHDELQIEVKSEACIIKCSLLNSHARIYYVLERQTNHLLERVLHRNQGVVYAGSS